MAPNPIELEFKPESHAICFLLDAPIVLSVIFVSYFFANVVHFLTPLMTWVMFGAIAFWLGRFFNHSKKCDETEVKVYPDRIEAEVGMKNPKLTMIEFSNFTDVRAEQSYIQKIFKTYSIVFTYKSDFEEKDITFILRDFKDPMPICNSIKRAVEHAGLIKKMTK